MMFFRPSRIRAATTELGGLLLLGWGVEGKSIKSI